MELIQGSTEHYFLTRLEELKNDASNWHCLYFSFSKTTSNTDLTSDLSVISDKIDKLRTQTDVFAQDLHKKLSEHFEGSVCIFADQDVFVFVKIKDKMEKKLLDEIYKTAVSKLPKDIADMDLLSDQYLSYQKFADKKLLSARLYETYETLADTRKVSSIATRRKRRDTPLVMVVEDDRFTAHYAATILSAEFDLIVCKDGEDAVQSYIDNAPDIVFLDIHLPGMSGHDVLEAIHAADKDAFVVMLSVDTVRDNIVKAMQMGARKFIKKPFTKERLIETVKSSPYVRALLGSDRAGSEQMFH